jgi:anti-sigma B factor antagonist
MMHAPLKLAETPRGAQRCALAVEGELDVATAPQFRTSVSALLGTGCRHLEIDLAGTAFMDSSGLGALVWAAHRFHAAGGAVTVVNPTPPVAKTMQITGVDRVLAPQQR